jgi:hypothetical protein
MKGALLELSFESDGRREIYGSESGPRAMEAWYLYQYGKEIRDLRALARDGAREPAPFPRREKYLLLYALLQSCELRRVTEIGSSLLEVIDGIEAAHAAFGRYYPGIGIEGLHYVGIEPSRFLNDVSLFLHPDHDVVTVPSVEALYERYPQRCGGVIYDRIVSSSAFQDAASLARFLGWFDAGILNLLTSREETFTASFLGAHYTYFSLSELHRLLPQPLYHLFGFRAPKHADARETNRPVIEGFFFYGSEARLNALMAAAGKCAAIDAFFREKQVSPQPVSVFT